ncbi:MAG: cell well associated RhsD [Bacteroidetes bacterium]|nr:MAG: cell well associated RhsD [Bacteroidota bacterium]
MNYDGNQLFGVDDRIKTDYGYNFFDNGHTCNSITREYDYDANGNITCDRNKEIIGISYNHLNLPKVVEFRNNNKLDYLYDANGTK